jgi:hypothetical protein
MAGRSICEVHNWLAEWIVVSMKEDCARIVEFE